MRICTLTCAAVIASVPASAQEPGLVIDLLPGHVIYHEGEREAGVVTAISITPEQDDATDLQGLCEELRVAAGLRPEHAENLRLEVIFVVPYKGMAIEGYYLPAHGTSGSEVLVRGNDIARETLDGIVGRAGLPSRVLDEEEVEHEFSCEVGQPAWFLRWEDVRLIGSEEPDEVIDRAYGRFMSIHRSVIEHATGMPQSADSHLLGANRLARSSSPRAAQPHQARFPKRRS